MRIKKRKQTTKEEDAVVPAVDTRKVHFAEHEDIFIIQEDGDDPMCYPLGMSASENNRSAPEEGQQEAEEEEASFQESYVDIQKNVRECVYKWFNTPYWRLLEGSVDDEDGEAKDVQKYITSFARIELDEDIPRGLERQLCRGHHEARKALSENATHAVLAQDFKLRYDSNAKISDDEVWKALRSVYKEHSRGAKAFARKMGKADEAAVQRDTLGEEQALELIEELQERSRCGAIRVKRCSSMTEVQKRHPKSEKERGTQKSNSGSWIRSRSASDPLAADSDHTTNSFSPKREKSWGKRKTPFRVPSMPSMRNTSKGGGGDNTKEQPGNDGSHAEDLFHEVDKKGKTKRSSRWRDLKKRLSKKVHDKRSPRTQ